LLAVGEGLDGRDDEALLRAHVDGDPDAFAVLFRRHRDRLWAVALRTMGDREDAADALQDALLSAHRAAPRFRGESAVTTWLHRIVVNACLDRIRRRQAHPTVPLPDRGRAGDSDRPAAAEPAAPATDHDTALVVREALAKLPVEQRAALVLVDLQGYAVAEVAAILGVAEGTIKSRCARGRARLAMLLGHLRPVPPDVGRTTAGNHRTGDSVTSTQRSTDDETEGVS
jgi:RNA polymerase sigma-70 factor (ECF subfamily)